MEGDLNNQGVQENNNTQNNNSDNMYSYRDDSQNIHQSGAIRRSVPENNQNDYNNYYNNNNSNNKPNYINKFKFQDDNTENTENNSPILWVPYLILAILEGVIILALALLFELEFDLGPTDTYNNITSYDVNDTETNLYNYYTDEINFDYGKLRDLNIMAFIGFGLLHSILKKNSWTSISLNSLLLAISIQISLFFNFVWKMAFKEKWVGEDMDIYFINKAIFISCSISITYGCVLGKLSFIQYLIMAIFETILATMNFQLLQEKLETVDTGGALYIHTFGAAFALSISVVLFCSSKAKNKIRNFENFNRSSYFSNITSFIGLLFLIVFYPSFNSVLCLEQMNVNRARINTYLSIFGSVIGSLVTSGIINEGKVLLEQIIYGTLSGAIIISGCCSVCLYQWAALILGTLSSAIAVIFLAKIKPFFVGFGLRDVCNVLIIHGIFGILGGFITPMFIRGLSSNDVKEYQLFYDTSRSRAKQAGIQVGGLFITLGISFVGGIATGFLMKVSTCNELNWLFYDREFFKDFEDDIDNRLEIDDDKGSQPSYN